MNRRPSQSRTGFDSFSPQHTAHFKAAQPGGEFFEPKPRASLGRRLLLALLLTQFVAFPCSIAFGRFSAKYDTGLLIKICILCYTGITLFAVFLVSQWQFWVLAVLVGMFQGGIQALSRSYLGKIIPAERSGEYFGLMDICGKGASFLGTTLIAMVSQFTDGQSFHVFGLELQNENIAVGTLVVIFAIGFVLFCKADKLNNTIT